MINLDLPRELVAKCILDRDLNETVSNAVVLSLTSKVMQTFINSIEFFEAYAHMKGAGHFLPKLNQTLSSFKDRCFELRGLCFCKNETFSGAMFGDALINGGDVELFSFDKGISSLILKENETLNSIVIPEHMQVDPREYYRISPLVARSEKYLAVNDRSNSCVYIFTSDGKECLSKYEVKGVISQIAIHGNQLFVVEKDAPDSIVKVFYLKLTHDYSMHAFDSDFPISICFGKEYWAYSVSNQCMSRTIINSYSGYECFLGGSSKGSCYLFSRGNDFIEVVLRDGLVCDIVKISFTEDCMQQTMIAEGIEIPVDFKGLRADVCLHDDRLVVAYEYGNQTRFFSYDLVLEKMGELTSVALLRGGHPFKARFFCVAQNIYYLIMHMKSNLSTFTFSKI
jgi:hypothetical protein